jgi:hypothetical protein
MSVAVQGLEEAFSFYLMKLGISHFAPPTLRVAVIAACACFQGIPAMGGPVRTSYPGGLSTTVYAADELATRLTTYKGLPAIQLPDGRFVPVITDIADPSIHNKGDGEFHPFSPALVDQALSSIALPGASLDVRVYLLPYPRSGVLVSSTTGNELFLSPHVLDIDRSVAAYIIAHELGHAFHNRFMPVGSRHWDEYRALRGIADENRFNDSAAHAYRPREIFAEDFRVLFGGAAAYYGGHVENTQIPEPGEIDGLSAFYERVALSAPARDGRIAATSYPNPFNPETEIRIALPFDTDGSERISVRVYAVTGALVRELHDGMAAGDLVVRWDGKDDEGNRVASATYYAQIRMGEERETLKLVLLK